LKTLLVVAETLGLLWLVVRTARRSAASPPPYGRRLFAIAGLLLGQIVLLYVFAVGVFDRLSVASGNTLYGLAWLTQAGRAFLLFAALRLWLGIARPELSSRKRWIALGVGLVGFGWGGGAFPLIAFAAMAWLMSRLQWPRQLGGWRRAVALLLSPILLVALTLLAVATAGRGGVGVRVAAASDIWPPPLIFGTTRPWAQLELALARPLDRMVQAIIDLFRVQLLVLFLRMLTLPIRLSGMSLKRRFTVNYVLVRQIPGVIGTLVLAVSAYLAFGVIKAGQVRGAFDRTLARASAVGAGLLADPAVVRGGDDATARLEAAREWLGPDGARAHLLLRPFDAAVRDTAGPDSVPLPPAPALARSARAPASLVEVAMPRTRDGRLEGVVQAGDGIYLVSRVTRESPAPARALDVFVPLDSTYLGDIARRIGARIEVNVHPGVSVRSEGITFDSDTASTLLPMAVRSGSAGQRSGRTAFLARSFLPYGDWRSGWLSGLRGAIAVELHLTRALLLQTLRDVPGWLFSNIFTVGILIALVTLTGLTESMAVRSGRTIVQAVESEVVQLREAAARFGAGDLAHRVPVRGRDELSALAGSFNEMAANLERQRTELIEKERIEEDLEVARQIQRRFLPQQPPAVPGLDVAGLSVPSREVGGDLFYYVELPGPRLAVALGDVSGKSVPAALLMSNVMSALRAEVQHETEVERSLARINRLIVEQIEPGRFVTLFYGAIEPGANRLRYSSAGHNPALRLGADGHEEWLGEGGLPLGVLSEAGYPAAEATLGPGDLLVVYSDGVTEAEGAGPGGAVELFGEQRLVDVVRSLRDRPADAVVQGILAAVQRFAAGRPQADDITLVVARRA
jgi:serine phosphatase RsbU (regulator of sigma subunit)